MEKIHHNKIQQHKVRKGSVLPADKATISPAEQVRSDEVERVLEHISSPYRWELLEVPAAQPKSALPKKSTGQKNHKSGEKR